MRIAMLMDGWWPMTGGGPVHVRELSLSLARNFDHTIDIYTRSLVDDDGTAYTETETLSDGQVTIHRCGRATTFHNPLGRLSSVVSPLAHLRRTDYDIVHGHTFLPAIPTRLSKFVGSAPTVFTVHGTAIPSGVGIKTSSRFQPRRLIERLLLLWFDYDHVVSVNQKHLGLLERHHDSVSCIPNGVDIDRFETDERPEPGRILFLGRLAPKKRVSDLIDAYERIHDEYPDSELVIVGTGPLEGDLKAQASASDAADSIQFEGRVSDESIPTHYANASVFVLPSVWEGHPLTLLEAWASSVPVIASDVEGIAEFVDHDENGYLVESESPPELADALRVALSDPERVRSWGERGRALVEERYTWEGVARRTDELYRQLRS